MFAPLSCFLSCPFHSFHFFLWPVFCMPNIKCVLQGGKKLKHNRSTARGINQTNAEIKTLFTRWFDVHNFLHSFFLLVVRCYCWCARMVAMHIQCNWFPAFFVLAVATIHYTNVLCWSQHKPSSILASHGVFCSSRFNNYDSGQQCVIHFFLPIIKWLCSTNKPTFTIILNRRTFASSFVFV